MKAVRWEGRPLSSFWPAAHPRTHRPCRLASLDLLVLLDDEFVMRKYLDVVIGDFDAV